MGAKHGTENGDAEAVRYCADEEALARVLEAARGPAGAVAQRVVRNWHTAEDVVQEALLRAVVAQDSLQSKDNPEGWFLGVVRNIAVDRVRREVREREIMETLSAAGLSDDVFPHQSSDALQQEELRDLIREAMRQLSEHNRRVVDLFYLKNRTLQQVADCLGVSPNTVKQRLFRARDMLRHALAALSMDAYSLQKPAQRKAILMKTAPQLTHATHDIPDGWHLFGFLADRYSIRLDRQQRRIGDVSVRLAAERVEGEQSAGLMQRFDARPWRGRTVRVRLWIKGEGIVEERGFRAFLEAHDALDVGHNVYWPRCEGTFDWRPMEAVIAVPDRDCALTVGFQIFGPGTLWVDRVEIEDAAGAAPSIPLFHSISWPEPMNLDFSDASPVSPATGRMPGLAPGWFLVNYGPEEHTLSLVTFDRQVFQTGTASVRIDHRWAPTGRRDMIYQRVPVRKDWQGKHLRLRGWVKSEAAERGGLWLRTDAGDQATNIDDMRERPITGEHDWSSFDLVAPISPDITHVAYGGLLSGGGVLWVDRLELAAVGRNVPCTSLPLDMGWKQPRTLAIYDAPRNLDFSEPIR